MRSLFSTVSVCAQTLRRSVRTVCDPWSSASALKRRRLWLRSHSQPFSTLKAASSASHVLLRASRSARLRRIAVVAGQPVQGELQHNFAGARRPGAIKLDVRSSVAPTPACKPTERALDLIDDDTDATEIRFDLLLRQDKV